MKILLYTNSFLPLIGGREIVVHYLARELKEMGHNVRVLGPYGWIKNRKLRFGYPVHRWPNLRGFLVEQVQYTQLNLDTRIWGCDVIHAHSTYPSGYIAAKFKCNKRVPLVITPHGEDIHVISEIGFGLRLNPKKREKIDFSLHNAELVTAISESIATSLINAGCPTNKIRKIPNGIDLERFKQKRQPNMRKMLKIKDNAPIILSVGNYHPRKGHEVLLHAMPLIIKNLPSAQLVIVGRTQDKLKELAKSLNIMDNVNFTGSIPFPGIALNGSDFTSHKNDDQLSALYCESDVYVSSGIDEGAEGLSLALLDAMAASLPVVATNISGNKDLIQSGKNGLLVPQSDPVSLANAVLKILQSTTLMASCKLNNINAVAKYSWKAVACQYLKVYQEASSLPN